MQGRANKFVCFVFLVACFSHDDTLKESSAARVSSMRSQDRKPVYRPELKSCGQLTVERDVQEEDDVGCTTAKIAQGGCRNGCAAQRCCYIRYDA